MVNQYIWQKFKQKRGVVVAAHGNNNNNNNKQQPQFSQQAKRP
jgi:uncharacterized Rossmann fold enzyme